MTDRKNDWNSFMQSRPIQVVMYGACTIFCAYYAIDAVFEILSPERSVALVETLGTTGYYALTILRLAVCLWAAVAFGRMTIKLLWNKDDIDDKGNEH